MNRWVDFYANVMGFSLYQHFDDEDISTEYSSLMSKVMANGNRRVKFPLNEPAEGRRKSQIEEYLKVPSRAGRAAYCARRQRHSAHREAGCEEQGVGVSSCAAFLLRAVTGAHGQH